MEGQERKKDTFWLKKTGGNKMGSVQMCIECEQCSYEFAMDDYNYRTGERLTFCPRCGLSIPWLQSHSIRYREPSIPNDRAT